MAPKIREEDEGFFVGDSPETEQYIAKAGLTPMEQESMRKLIVQPPEQPAFVPTPVVPPRGGVARVGPTSADQYRFSPPPAPGKDPREDLDLLQGSPFAAAGYAVAAQRTDDQDTRMAVARVVGNAADMLPNPKPSGVRAPQVQAMRDTRAAHLRAQRGLSTGRGVSGPSVIESPVIASRVAGVQRAPFDVPEQPRFYSALDRALENNLIPRQSGTGPEWMKELERAQHRTGFTMEEVKHRGLTSMMERGSNVPETLGEFVEPTPGTLTRGDVSDRLKTNPMNEVVKSEILQDLPKPKPHDLVKRDQNVEVGFPGAFTVVHPVTGRTQRFAYGDEAHDYAHRALVSMGRSGTFYKSNFEQYPMEPGTYHEVVIRSPTTEGYQGHFGGEDLLGDMIAAERPLTDGRRSYGVFEAQSDLHKTAVKEGYRQGATPEAMKLWEAERTRLDGEHAKVRARALTALDDFDAELGKLSKAQVMELPVGSWTLKQRILRAAQNGARSMSTPMQVARAIVDASLESPESVPPALVATAEAYKLADTARYHAALAHDEHMTKKPGESGLPEAIYKGEGFNKHVVKRAILNAINRGLDTISWQTGDTIKQRWPKEDIDFRPQYDQKWPEYFRKLLGKDAVEMGEIAPTAGSRVQAFKAANRDLDLGYEVSDRAHLGDHDGPRFRVMRVVGNPNGGNFKVHEIGATDDLGEVWRLAMQHAEANKLWAPYSEKVWTARITPEVRDRIVRELGGLPFAKGGEVPNMSRETETHFHVGSLRIAKKGLTNGTTDAIRQHLACGGKVKPKKMAEGGDPAAADPATQEALAVVEAKLGPPVPGGQEAWDYGSKRWTDPAAVLSEPPRTEPGVPAGLSAVGPASDRLHPAMVNPDPSPSGTGLFRDVPATQAEVQRVQAPLVQVDPAVAHTPADQTAPNFVAAPGQPGYQIPPEEAAPPSLPPTTGDTTDLALKRLQGQFSGDMGRFQAASDAQAVAMRKRANFEREYANLDAQLQKERAEAVATAQRAAEVQLARNQAQAEAVARDVFHAKIDPNKFWNDASTGQKIAGAIGMLLSGMGSGVTGQRNLAMDVIDKAIERDIDAQKANIGIKQSMLGYFMSKTQNDLQARLLTMAMYKEVVGAKLAQTAATFAGQTAGLNAEIALNELKKDTAKTHMQMVGVMQEQAMRQADAKMNLVRYEFLRQAVETGTVPASALTVMGGEFNKTAVVVPGTPQIARFNPDGTPVLVETPPRVELTNTEKEAEKARNIETNVNRANRALMSFKAIAGQMRSGTFDPQLIARAKSVMYELHDPLGLLAGGGDTDTRKEYKNITELINQTINAPDKVWGANWDKPMETIAMVERILARERAVAAGMYLRRR